MRIAEGGEEGKVGRIMWGYFVPGLTSGVEAAAREPGHSFDFTPNDRFPPIPVFKAWPTDIFKPTFL